MTPEIGKFIKVFFRNGVQLEGTVVSWSDTKSVLRSESRNLLVINKTLEDVMFYKIETGIFSGVKENIKEEFQKIADITNKEPEDIKRLAELKIELNRLEKEEISQRMRTHTADNLRETNYGLPGSAIAIKGITKHSRKEAAPEDTGFGAELQNLFRKKD